MDVSQVAKLASAAGLELAAVTSVAGCSPHPLTSSIHVKNHSATAAGQRPSRSGYGRLSDGSSRPIARNGLNAR